MEEFWNRAAKKVAQDLLGKGLVIGRKEAVVLKAQGYPPGDNTGIYSPVLEMSPGQVYCPRQRNAILLLIVTKDGGCVLVRIAEVDGHVYNGPGKLTKALGMTEPRVQGRTEWVDEDTIAVHLESALETEVPAPRSRSVPDGNRIGKETLRRLMPKITATYLRDRPDATFEEYLNGLLEQCNSEAELRRKLR